MAHRLRRCSVFDVSTKALGKFSFSNETKPLYDLFLVSSLLLATAFRSIHPISRKSIVFVEK